MSLGSIHSPYEKINSCLVWRCLSLGFLHNRCERARYDGDYDDHSRDHGSAASRITNHHDPLNELLIGATKFRNRNSVCLLPLFFGAIRANQECPDVNGSMTLPY